MGYKILNDGHLLKVEDGKQVANATTAHYDATLLHNVIDKFESLLRIIIPNVPFSANHINPMIFDRYVKLHIESHNVVPDLYMQHIIDMPWEKFVVEYLKDAVEIGQKICEELKKDDQSKDNLEITATQINPPKPTVKRNSDGLLFKMDELIRENKQLKAVIEAEKTLKEMLDSKTVFSEVERKALAIKAEQTGIPAANLGEDTLPRVRVNSKLINSRKRKPTVNQMINETYANCDGSMQDFLSCFDDKFLGENLEQLRKFARRLFVDGEISEQDWQVFKAYESDFRNWQPSQETNITLR